MITGPELVNAALKALNCKLPIDTGLDGLSLQLNMTEWSHLAAFMIDLYDYTEAGESARVKRDVVVVGAGPIGLLHALEARALGSRVTVVEKRTHYVRNVWFDLGPEAWFRTLSHLQSMGVLRLSFESVTQYTDAQQSDSGKVITVRCKELETTLAKVAFVVGIDLKFGTTFCTTDALESGTERLVAVVASDCNASEGQKTHLPYDLLLGSDGTNSKVRQSVFFAYSTHNGFNINSRIPMRIPGLNQPTLLLNLKPEADGTCKTSKSSVVDSFDVGSALPGVTHVFKRFYLGHCHLQLLFTQQFAKQHFSKESSATTENDLPWPTILDVVNQVFEIPFKSVEEFKDSIVKAKKEDGSNEEALDVQYFQIEIKRTNHALFRPQLGPNKKPSSLVAIVGDASITAHYRLGVGINNGIRQIDSVTRRALMLPSFDVDEAIEDIDNEEWEHLQRLANFEAYLIAAESYCDYVVTFDLTKPIFSHETYLRSRNQKSAQMVQLKGMDTFTSCEAFSG